MSPPNHGSNALTRRNIRARNLGHRAQASSGMLQRESSLLPAMFLNRLAIEFRSPTSLELDLAELRARPMGVL
jgi:hypothetical protein